MAGKKGPDAAAALDGGITEKEALRQGAQRYAVPRPPLEVCQESCVSPSMLTCDWPATRIQPLGAPAGGECPGNLGGHRPEATACLLTSSAVFPCRAVGQVPVCSSCILC